MNGKVRCSAYVLMIVFMVFSHLQADDFEGTDQATATASAVRASAESVTDINWQVISSGGDVGGVSDNFGVSGTVGQTAVGSGGSDNYGVGHGFWQDFTIACDCVPGDPNDDGTFNVGDAVYIITYIFRGGPAPVPYQTCNGDTNCDCKVNIGDAVYMIWWIFQNGPRPCTCEDWLSVCGPPLRE